MTDQNSFFSTDARHQRPFSSAAQLPLRSMSASRPSVIPPGLDHDSSQTPVFDVTQRLFLPDISQRLTAARPSVAALCFHIRPICSSIQRQQQTKAVEDAEALIAAADSFSRLSVIPPYAPGSRTLTQRKSDEKPQ